MANGGFLYAIRAEGTSLVKIGYTTGSVDTRVKQLQTGQPFPLRVIATLSIDQDARQAEAFMHAFLAQDRRIGEWFEMTLEPQEFPVLVEHAMAFGAEQEAQRQAELARLQEEKERLWRERHPPLDPKHGLDLRVFGQRVRARRHESELSQQALADLMDAPQGWISELENARQTHVQADTVFRLCRALGVSADYLLGLVDVPTSVPARPKVVTPFRQPGIWKGKLSPDWDAHFDDLDEEIVRMFEGEDDDAAPR